MATEEHVNNPHDKIIRDVLLDKEEGAYFINKALNLKEEEKLSEKNLYNYNNSFVNSKLQNKISDVVYKVVKYEGTKDQALSNKQEKIKSDVIEEEEREIYIIIEHQSKKEPLMEYRFFDYKVEVTRLALDKSKVREETYSEPSVIGILLYTGKDSWRKESQKDENEIKEKRTLEYWTKQGYTKYQLVEASKIPEEELLKENTLLSKILLLEKAENKEEIMAMYSKIMNQKLSTKAIEKIEKYIIIVLSQVFKRDKKELEQVLKKFKRRENKMMHIEEVLIRERDSWLEEGKSKGRLEGRVEGRKSGLAEGKKSGLVEGRKKGKLEERLKIIRKMIKGKVKDELIKEYTNANEQELEKIKKEMQSQAV